MIKLLLIFGLFGLTYGQCPRYPHWPREFRWSYAGHLGNGWRCTRILEPSDPYTWADNYFCERTGPAYIASGMRWSYAGPISGMRCTRIIEFSSPAKHTWRDNYLCVPHHSPFVFEWSMAGPIPGKHCIQWIEPSEPLGHTWRDNYLCGTVFPRARLTYN
ncbi:uncharacterized protein [Clytia hemisphaerica]